ncbi:16S rRNA (guanine(527)-N(7))-methyltransferase RsmG [Pseudooceanicola sp.]|uniref:16S rRNA (guanine(527)-N(7))-methyltransferase RsmG n=1 Tax=Pseudooceanicola sp. TaxID=1914328 RepID=UPI0035C78A0D
MGTTLENVSRETQERLEQYLALLNKWNPRINLVAKTTVDDAWTRHFEDSAQLLDLVPQPKGKWLDMGSGGGFPGLVVAILLQDSGAEADLHLMESDQRKSAFLRTVSRELGLKTTVKTQRIESAQPEAAQIISARALADLSTLLGFAKRHGTDQSIALFPKGRRWQEELSQAQEKWRFKHEARRSNTDPEAVILRIEEIEHV